MEQSICLISFSPIYRDARVLRQIRYLAPHYRLTVIGYGQPHPDWQNHPQVKWISVAEGGRRLTKPVRLALLLLARLQPRFYDNWYWQKSHHTLALTEALASDSLAYHANDWEALPVAAEAAKKTGARLIFDAHEYAPLEFEDVWTWRLLHAPAISYFLRQYAPIIDASTTVAPLIATRYQQEFKLEPVVVLNTPDPVPLPERDLDFDHIRLIHHGAANRNRCLESMVQTIARCDRRFSLHFMLVETDPEYVSSLKRLADQLAPGRVIFHPAVTPENIVQQIAEYDMGFYLLDFHKNYNNQVALPNKFFDFIAAGLAVCIGPSPSMAEIVRRYSLGCVAPTLDPDDVALMLNRLSAEQLLAMRRSARVAAKEFNATHEMGKLVGLYDQLLGEGIS
jgi:glycosyltransferase involved in cell wall biosynthesis